MLTVLTFPLGPLQTNTWLIAEETGEAVVVDPAWDSNAILGEVQRRNWRIGQIWCTHAHFDHIGGVAALTRAMNPPPPIALHADDRPLWAAQGGAHLFGFPMPTLPMPTLILTHGQFLSLGRCTFEVLHTPGHTPGHCVFYCAEAGLCLCGDLIFQGNVGRTDLPGGDWTTLVQSIHTQIFSLPEATRLLPGHGPQTTVGEEKRNNPFVQL